MLWYFAVGMLAAYGFFCALWAMLGWLLPKGDGCAVCCFGLPEEGMLWRYKWMTGLGIWRLPLLAVAEDASDGRIEICSREELIPRLERERIGSNGTGNGDHPGRDQCCGISEL